MVSGGTYGTEEIIHGAGYGRGILILLLLPVFWSLPTAFMIGELSSALPAAGGYYAWVRRAMGNFWGFQEAWLSLAASIFDMAIYPTLFVFYLKQMSPWFEALYATRGRRPFLPRSCCCRRLIEMLYSARSERLLMGKLTIACCSAGYEHGRLIWDPTVFTNNRDCLL